MGSVLHVRLYAKNGRGFSNVSEIFTTTVEATPGIMIRPFVAGLNVHVCQYIMRFTSSTVTIFIGRYNNCECIVDNSR